MLIEEESMSNADNYVKPEGPYIPSTERKLYRLEEKRNDAIHEAAVELGNVLGHDERQFWTRTVPEALLSVLQNFDRTAARLAAEAFLEKMRKEGGDEEARQYSVVFEGRAAGAIEIFHRVEVVVKAATTTSLVSAVRALGWEVHHLIEVREVPR